MIFDGEERLEWEICVDKTRLEQVPELKYFGCVLDELGTDVAKCRRSGERRRV